MDYWPEILQVIPVEGRKVYLYFDDGTIRLYDATDQLSKGRFRELLEGNLFYETCTVINHTLAWTLDGTYCETTSLDIDPTFLYETSPIVDEPHWLFANQGGTE